MAVQRTQAMTRERWAQIKAAFEAALGQPPEKRDKCVRDLCRQDSELEAEVRVLLEAHDLNQSFLHKPAVAAIGYFPEGLPHTLTTGEVLAERFEIVRYLNSGGMGEVYEAWDRELQEQIALKTIRSEIASSTDVLERFKQEVKRARGISHANICRVYDLFQYQRASGQSIWFLTMELLCGQTLAECLRTHGPIKPEKALPLVRQMVAGLAAAHELEIVHRDFKTGNVMLVDAGRGKLRAVITDFGLALNVGEDGLSAPGSSGTPDYMAPEQARGEAVGFAADQFALGIVMCEMVAGCRPQRCGNQVTLPVRRQLPLPWAAAIRRCLQTRPQDRFKSISELVAILDPQKRRKTKWWIAAAAASFLIVAVLATVGAGSSRESVQDAIKITSETDLSTDPSLSRDGKTLAYISDRDGLERSDVWIQHLPVASPPVRVATDATAGLISVSPDGSVVAFRSERASGGIYVVNTTGGGERMLAPGGRDPRFSPDGQHILYWKGNADQTVPSGQLYVIPVAGGPAIRMAGNFQDARHGIWSPNGQYILFTGCMEASQPLQSCWDWWVAGVDENSVRNTGALRILRNQGISINTIGDWCKDKILFSGRASNTESLWEINLSLRELKAIGPARQLTSGSNREIFPSLAEDGTIAYRHLIGALHVWRIDNASSRSVRVPTRVTYDAGIDAYPYVSHNGRWLAYARYRNAGERDHIEIRDLRLGNIVRVQESFFNPAFPIVDDSGTTVVFQATQDHIPGIFTAVRGSPPRKLCSGCNSPTGWFGDERAILYHEGLPSSIKIIHLDTGESNTVLEKSGVSLANANWSPQNQYLLFTATAGSKNRIYAIPLPSSTGKPGGDWIPITEETEWADRPRWAGDGKTIFYISTRDGFYCIWGQRFDSESGEARGRPFVVKHYHSVRLSPGLVVWEHFNLATTGSSIYFNPGEQNGTIWIGKLKEQDRLHFFEPFWR